MNPKKLPSVQAAQAPEALINTGQYSWYPPTRLLAEGCEQNSGFVAVIQ